MQERMSAEDSILESPGGANSSIEYEKVRPAKYQDIRFNSIPLVQDDDDKQDFLGKEIQKDAMPRRKNKSPTKGRQKKGSKTHSRQRSMSKDKLPPVVSTSKQKLLTKRAKSHFRMQNHLQSSNALTLNPNIRPKKHQQFIGPKTMRDITDKIDLKQSQQQLPGRRQQYEEMLKVATLNLETAAALKQQSKIR